MTKMKIIKGAGVSADTLEIVVEKDEQVVFSKKYYCGYDYSWKKCWATKEKPFEDDLINQIKEQYGVEEVVHLEGKRCLPNK